MHLLGLNSVDWVILLVLLLYILSHVSEGFFVLFRRLVAFVGGAILAFLTYGYLSHLLSIYVHWPIGYVDALSFIIAFFILERVISFFLGELFAFIPPHIQYSKPSRFLAVIPAAIDGVILVSLLLFLIVVAPIFASVKEPIASSRIGSSLVSGASGIEGYLDQIFGKATEQALGFLTVEPQEGQTIKLPFQATKLSPDAADEAKMLQMVNTERAKVGATPLVMDAQLREVARAHSTDMWQKSYFSHIDPAGNDPFQRMRAAGVKFNTAGENLALAHTLERAMDGLMNSPGHRRNILDPDFHRVGIGIIDGGIYGKMFTQEFTD